MTFPVGVWTLSANNDTGTLTINSVALATGGAPFGGTVAFAQGGSFPIVGLLDETTRAFNFLLIDSSTSPPISPIPERLTRHQLRQPRHSTLSQ